MQVRFNPARGGSNRPKVHGEQETSDETEEMEKNCCTAPTVVMYNSLDDAGGMGSCESPVQKSHFRYFEN